MKYFTVLIFSVVLIFLNSCSKNNPVNPNQNTNNVDSTIKQYYPPNDTTIYIQGQWGSLNLIWYSKFNSTLYRLQIAADSMFYNSIIKYNVEYDTTQLIYPHELYYPNLYWRVRIMAGLSDTMNERNWSKTWHFNWILNN